MADHAAQQPGSHSTDGQVSDRKGDSSSTVQHPPARAPLSQAEADARAHEWITGIYRD